MWKSIQNLGKSCILVAPKTLLISRQAEFIGAKEFIITPFNLEYEIFIINRVSVSSSNQMYFFRRAEIALLKINETSTTIFPEYFNFANVFSPKLETELSEHTKINNHVIDLVDSKQSI